MRLISCHIENFGKLSDETFEFDNASGLNIICRDNGWGKSTFATFIKVMFFGFDNDGKRNDIENERRHFKPWQGGVYGGRVIFEAGGKSYVMSRTFGAKEKDDEFILQDLETNLETGDFSENIGEELFQIDRASFLRSVYISQNDCKASATDSINAKLGNLADSTDDLNNFESANKRITDRLNALSRRRKTGILYKQKEKIADLKQQIKNGQSVDSSMDEILRLRDGLNEDYVKLKDEQKTLQEKQKLVSEYKDLEVKKNEYRHLCDEFEGKQNIFEEKAVFFPERIPTEDEVEKYIKVESDDLLLKKELDIYNMDESELSELNLLEGRFASGIPDSGDIGEKYQDIQTMQEILQRIEKSMLTEDERREFDRLSEKFSEHIPTQDEIDDMSQAWSQRTEKKNALSSKKAAADMLAGAGNLSMMGEKGNAVLENDKNHSASWDGSGNGMSLQSGIGDAGTKKQYSAGLIIILAAVIVIGVIGVYSLAKSLPACIVFVIVMVLAGFIGIKLLNTNKEKFSGNNIYEDNINGQNLSNTLNDEQDKANPYDDLIKEISEDEEIIAVTEREAMLFFRSYGMVFDEDNVTPDLIRFREDLRLYGDLLKKSQRENVEELCGQYREIKNGLMEFLLKYGFLENEDNGTELFVEDEIKMFARYRNLLYSLEKAISNYVMLKEKKQKYDSAFVSHKRNIETLETFMSELDMRFEEDIYLQLQKIKDILRDYIKAKEECDKAEELKKSYEENHDDLEKIKNAEIKEDLSLAEIEERLSEISLEVEKYHTLVNDYNHQLEQLQEKKDNIMDFERQLDELQETFERNGKMEKTLQKTQKYLVQAKTSLIAKYTKPVKDSFDRYCHMLSDIETQNYQLDADFNMSVLEKGMPRDIGFLSTGCQDMVGICMRMALVDAMYGGEKPFVVFDDPFVNFDGKKTEGGLKMLKEIAKEYQVIYFTCNEMRA